MDRYLSTRRSRVSGLGKSGRLIAAFGAGVLVVATIIAKARSLPVVVGGSFLVLTVIVSLASRRLGALLLFPLVFALPLAPALPFMHADEINYDAFATGLLVFVAGAHALLNRKLRIDMLMFVWGWAAIQSVLFVGPLDFIRNWTTSYMLPLMPMMALAFYYLASHYSHPDDRKRLVQLFLVLCVVESIIGLGQSIFGMTLLGFQGAAAYVGERGYVGYLFPRAFSTTVQQATGTFEHFNGLGSLLSTAVPMAWGLWIGNRRSILRGVVLAVICSGLILTYSRGALIGAVCGVAAIQVIRQGARRFAMLATIAVVCIIIGAWFGPGIISYYENTQNMTSRVNTIEYALDSVRERPQAIILGFGYTYFRTNILTSGQVLSNLHSSHLQLLLELGLVGFVPYILYFYQLLRQTFRQKENLAALSIGGAILAFLIHQLFENALFGYQGAIMILFAGLAAVANREGWLGVTGSRNNNWWCPGVVANEGKTADVRTR